MPGFATRAIKAASRVPDAPQPPVNVPIYQTSTFEVANALDISNTQAKVWLLRLVSEGVVDKQKKPAGYIVKRFSLF